MKARKTREEIGNRVNKSNIKFYRCYGLQREGIVQSRSIKEAIRIIDAREEEKKYIEKKFEYKADFIDIEARNSFQTNKVTTSIIKCAYRYNHYGLRDAIINNNIVEVNCP